MKLFLKLALLTILLTTSSKSFSQTTTIPPGIQLDSITAKSVIQDLIKCKGYKQELEITTEKVTILEKKSSLKDSIIFNLDTQINNFNSILEGKDTQLSLSQELSEKLKLDLKKQKLKTKLFSGIGLTTILGVVLILK